MFTTLLVDTALDLIPPAEAGHPVSDPAVTDVVEERLTEILDWLWTTVAAPVLAAMTNIAGPGMKLRWVPTGVLSFLPSHAATSGETGESVLDRVVPSYSPTVSALSHPSRTPGSSKPCLAVIVSGEPGGGLPKSPRR